MIYYPELPHQIQSSRLLRLGESHASESELAALGWGVVNIALTPAIFLVGEKERLCNESCEMNTQVAVFSVK